MMDEMEMKEEEHKFEEALEEFKKKTLKIGNCEKEKTRFMQLAKEEFQNNYAMALKWLLDFRDGLLTSPNQELSDKIDLLIDRINRLEQQFAEQKEKPKTKMIRSASGKIIKELEEENGRCL